MNVELPILNRTSFGAVDDLGWMTSDSSGYVDFPTEVVRKGRN